MQTCRSCRPLTVFRFPPYVAVLSLVAACQSGGSTDNSAVADGSTSPSDVPISSPETLYIKFDAGTSLSIDGGCLALTSCKAAGGQYCGIIGDGCGGNLDCGTCPAGQTCTGNVCSAGSGYDGGVLISCTVTGGQYCGDIGNGAGGKLSCGPCTTPGWTCTDGLCTASAAVCTPKVCSNGTSQYCGAIGDGCGHALDCGACGAGPAHGQVYK